MVEFLTSRRRAVRSVWTLAEALTCRSIVAVNIDKDVHNIYSRQSQTRHYKMERENNVNTSNEEDMHNTTTHSTNVPESCKDVATCSGTTTDGEYWIYPQATNRKRVKIYCNNMASNPTEYITLKNPNSFIDHDQSNWPIMWQQCQSSYIPPLKRVDFQKVGIQIQNMEVNGMDYSFALLTGTPTISYGRIRDCNGESFRSPCPHFASATINTKGTGLVIDPSLTWGVIDGSYPEMRYFQKSTDDSEISFTCSGWCSTCGPKPGPVVFQVSNEFISAADAQALICHN